MNSAESVDRRQPELVSFPTGLPVSGGSWPQVVEALTHAFQPIVQMRTGRCHGFEALLRGWERFGFKDPHAVFDAAERADVLADVETALQSRAVDQFKRLSGMGDGKLFLNVTAKLVGHSDRLLAAARSAGISLVHEISEREPTVQGHALDAIVAEYRRTAVGVALDDFGVGFAGLRLLYEARPDYVKIDRFFITGIDSDHRKRAIVSYLVSYAHTLGILTVAEGIETAAEFYACRDIGCDFGQGYLICRPIEGVDRLPSLITKVQELNQADRRRGEESRHRLLELVERIPPLPLQAPKAILLERFAATDAPDAVPVVDTQGVPRGLVRERDLKPFVYSQYGPDLLRNRILGNSLADFVVPCPVCDVGSPLERVVEVFAEEAGADGVIIVEGGTYVGFLSSRALIRLLHEQRLASATDQNPLTRLPGNAAISRHLEDLLLDEEQEHALIYFDFDHFKPFNDHFGFRQGDRAILMFSERLRTLAGALGGFAGHIGGDDFFLAVSGTPAQRTDERIRGLLDVFASDVESFYDAAARTAGWFEGKDRDGQPRRFPLLAVSAVQVVLTAGPRHEIGVDRIIELISRKKSLAKNSKERFVLVTLPEQQPVGSRSDDVPRSGHVDA